MNIHDWQKMKVAGEKISMVTCYDYTSARLLAQTQVNCLLVGDSVAMTMHGHPDTLSATLAMMALHTAAVRRGAGNTFIVSDLPFMSYRKSLTSNMDAVQTLVQAGAHAVKLEGATGNLKFIRHVVDSGVPVMGHLGLTPQFIHQLGGYKVQGKTASAAERILADALALQDAGCFAVVLECVPGDLAAKVTQSLNIPSVGIGAGAATDGQVLVWQDLLGFNTDFKPRFVKHYLSGAEIITTALNKYVDTVNSGAFPSHEHRY